MEIALPPLARRVEHAVMVDDIVGTGATLAALARALAAAGVARVATTDTIPHPTNRMAVAPILAAALSQAA